MYNLSQKHCSLFQQREAVGGEGREGEEHRGEGDV